MSDLSRHLQPRHAPGQRALSKAGELCASSSRGRCSLRRGKGGPSEPVWHCNCAQCQQDWQEN
eukprot:6206837-Pleurochrysis_carterae.AAC.1